MGNEKEGKGAGRARHMIILFKKLLQSYIRCVALDVRVRVFKMRPPYADWGRGWCE
jgi:hypothetical protein